MSVSVIIPAYQAADTIAETVRQARAAPGVEQVIVVDDGSTDGTGAAAEEAGADRVVVLPRNRGKGAALSAGVQHASCETLLFLDADLGASAREAEVLLQAAKDGRAMLVAVLPSRPGTGGLGILLGLARAAVRLLSGLQMKAPLSGQRLLPAALVRHIGIASGFGVEVGLTVEAAFAGCPVVEVPVAFDHRHTTRNLPGFLHRARQFREVLRLVLQIGYGLAWPALPSGRRWLRLAAWAAGFALLLAVPAGRPQTVWAAAGALALWLPSLWVGAVWLGRRKPNYLGRSIPAMAGLIVPVVGIPALWLAPVPDGARTAAVIVLGVMGLVGTLDDLFAERRQARGLRGHLRGLLRGRLTTGAVKALGGLAAGIAAGWFLHPGVWTEIALDALLIALCANTVNLLDLRPGRALKGFALLAAAAVAASPDSLAILGPVLAAALVLAPSDLSGRAMMGDVGSNTLGGVAGVALASALGPWGRLCAVVVLAALHVVCERVSLTEVFARNRLLRALDRLGAETLPPLTDRGEGEG